MAWNFKGKAKKVLGAMSGRKSRQPSGFFHSFSALQGKESCIKTRNESNGSPAQPARTGELAHVVRGVAPRYRVRKK